MLRIALIFAIAFLAVDDGSKKGRKGNTQYKAEKFAEAANTFREGLQEADTETPGATTSGLYNNFAAALHKEGKFKEAAEAFTHALRTADSDEDRSRAAFNAGNNAFQNQDIQSALDYYRQSLLANPENEEARYNYEFVQRQMQQQQQQQQGQQNQQQQPNNDGQENQQQEPQENQEEQDPDQQQDQPQPDEPDNGEQQQEPPPPQDPSQMSKEQAERILEAMQTDEKELLKDVRRMKGHKRNVEKDW